MANKYDQFQVKEFFFNLTYRVTQSLLRNSSSRDSKQKDNKIV